MRPEDVPDALRAAALEATLNAGQGDDYIRIIIAAVYPHIAAEALERAAVVVETHQAEVQQNINDNIAEVRVVQIKPSDNWPLIKARDWLKYIAAAIRALKETT